MSIQQLRLTYYIAWEYSVRGSSERCGVNMSS